MVAIAGFAGALLALGAMASCGSRTGLPGEEVADAADEQPLVHPDRGEEPSPKEDVVGEEPPGIDVNRPDVPVINPCPDAQSTLIYVIGSQLNTLYSFDPVTNSFATVGIISCPGSVGTPFSMAVDREGVAYVAFSTTMGAVNSLVGTGVFKVSTRTAACVATSYDPAKYGSPTFGMGFVATASADAGSPEGGMADGGSGESGAPVETLYVSQNNGASDGELFILDTTAFTLKAIGLYSPTVQMAELTGTGTGQLYAFQPYIPSGTDMTTGSFLFNIDVSTAKVLGTDRLRVGGMDLQAGSGWAFGYWGGKFYLFTGTGPTTSEGLQSTVVNQFDPASKTLVQVSALPTDTVVGAGVSTCAPP